MGELERELAAARRIAAAAEEETRNREIAREAAEHQSEAQARPIVQEFLAKVEQLGIEPDTTVFLRVRQIWSAPVSARDTPTLKKERDMGFGSLRCWNIGAPRHEKWSMAYPVLSGYYFITAEGNRLVPKQERSKVGTFRTKEIRDITWSAVPVRATDVPYSVIEYSGLSTPHELVPAMTEYIQRRMV